MVPDGRAGDLFVDSTRSRAGGTDAEGHFVFSSIERGRYVMQVRRLGFAPFEGVVQIDTAALEMELAMEQQVPILPRIRIDASALDRVTRKLELSGFIARSNMGTSGLFLRRDLILRAHVETLGDMLMRYGIEENGIYEIDRMPSDWTNVRLFPLDLVIGIEIYRGRGSVPVEFGRTIGGVTALNEGRLIMGNSAGSGGISRPTVIIWTYIP